MKLKFKDRQVVKYVYKDGAVRYIASVKEQGFLNQKLLTINKYDKVFYLFDDNYSYYLYSFETCEEAWNTLNKCILKICASRKRNTLIKKEVCKK